MLFGTGNSKADAHLLNAYKFTIYPLAYHSYRPGVFETYLLILISTNVLKQTPQAFFYAEETCSRNIRRQ